MTKTAPIRATNSAGVWLDHRRALIVVLTADGEVIRTVLSHVEKHLERGGDSPMKGSFEARQVPADDRRQHALTAELNVYYDALIAALRDCERVLVFGPGEAKGELHARMSKKQQGGRVAAVETTDQLTNRQIAAKVRAYFGAAAAPP